MLVLGISGSLHGELWEEAPPAVPYRWGPDATHDAAAVLIEDGRVVAAIEQERINRIKHSGGFPAAGIRACLDIAGRELRDVDLIALSNSHGAMHSSLKNWNFRRGLQGILPESTVPEDFMAAVLSRTLHEEVDPGKFRFVKHHLAHAASAFWPSGFEEALVVTIDSRGEDESGLVCRGGQDGLSVLRSFGYNQSLGEFYLLAMQLIGFLLFEEYKVMGLAPYGNPSVFRSQFSQLYELLPEGDFIIRQDGIIGLMEDVPVRPRSAPIEQVHMDYAAALQEALETLVIHILSNAREKIGIDRLCLAGGVAHNCSANGKLLMSSLFEEIFVQPAAHDGGLALGAALMALRKAGGGSVAPLKHYYLGRLLAAPAAIDEECSRWRNWIEFHRSDDVEAETANLIFQGNIVGWAQGRSEFGPRALGNRSILADPRPAENRERINLAVKKRERFRPFAPAVIEEEAGSFFEFPPSADLSFMTFAVRTKLDWRSRLGAVCHVDGTARVQVVRQNQNGRFWRLIREFGRLSGVPVLLNTSFNNNMEPIVDTMRDAIVTFLTTDLDTLVLGETVVTKRTDLPNLVGWLAPSLSFRVYLRESLHIRSDGHHAIRYQIAPVRSATGGRGCEISEAAYELLKRADGKSAALEIAQLGRASGAPAPILAELVDLWSRRLIEMSPPPSL